ncbi:MAG: peroxiredoxin [Vicinamibacteria bacterium]
MKRVGVGDRAPDFKLEAHNGEKVSLTDYRGKKTVVLYFYPKDETPGCTKEACRFRDSYEDFVKAGAVVIGASGDSPASHRAFAEKRHLPFLLVSDEDRSLRKAYGVPKALGLIPGRVTYVIDRDGIVRHVFNSMLQAERHVSEALDILRGMTSN